ncbi:MAG: hypothetical protein ACREIW_07775 [Chthoniobacterales bacterium]
MNDFGEMENELKKLRPAQPSPVLFERIEEALDDCRAGASPASRETWQPTRLRQEVASTRKHSVLSYNFAWGLGLAAAAVLILFVRVNLDRRQNHTKRVAQTTPAPANETRLRQGYSAGLREQAAGQASPETASTNEFIPAGLTQVVYRTRDEGLRFPNGYTQPVRRVRYQTHETMRWRNPATGASLRVSYPSEEVVFTPISGQ